ncbi:hypothetical protein BBD42_13055 [Paenibacillus sp. BIHB 4019]|uniref:Uncharacterized protein n=1 Tax=Paenibacillus sp. BIHB 4019 TaxID=1870819 RepID=A0A1B2DHZ5_9BACL|nr:hypothetical protein BBD42_13055 [Paenibacillus sp. BIHB 4019]
MDKPELISRLDAAQHYLSRCDLTKDQRAKAEKRRNELSESLKNLECSDERVVKSISAIRDLLKIKA